MSRVGSLALLNNTLRDISNVQEKLGTMQTQVSSGLKASDFAGLNGQVEQYTQLNAQISRTSQYQTGNTATIAKLQTADNALTQMQDIANGILSLIVTASGTTSDTFNFSQQMQDKLNALADELNITYQGSYIFSGTATDTKPVPDATVVPSQFGIPDANYYEGSQQNVTIRTDDQIQFEFPVRADNIAFQKIFAAAHQAMMSYDAGNQVSLQDSRDLASAGIDDLNAARIKVNNNILSVTDTNTRITALTTYWKGLTGDLANTDIVETTTQISNYQAVLQATFQIYARLSQLRLSDYLK